MITKRDIVKYYIAMFDRIPEEKAVNDWYDNSIKNNWDEKQLVSALFNAAVEVVNSNEELKKIYPQYVNYNNNDASSARKVIESIYKALFDKDYKEDPNGINFWVNQIINKKMNISDAIVNIEHFTEEVYNNKINLDTLNYSKTDIEHLKYAVETFESRVEYANIVYPVLNNINFDKIKLLQEDINSIHSSKDFYNAYELLITNIYNNQTNEVMENIEKNLENISDSSIISINNEENLGFIDLPGHYEHSIEESMYLL